MTNSAIAVLVHDVLYNTLLEACTMFASPAIQPRRDVMALEKELATYKARLEELCPQEGRFVLICGDDVAGIWETYQDALQAGYQKFGLNPFLVKQILWTELVHNLR